MDDILKDLQACPLDRVWVPGHYGAALTTEKSGITLERTTPTSLVQLSLFPGQEKKALTALKKQGIQAFPESGHADLATKLSIYSLGAGRYWLESAATDLHSSLASAIPAETGSVTDLSSALTALTVSGSDVTTVLAKGIAVDLHTQNFLVGKVAQTNVHHMPVMLVRLETNQFRLFAFSTYAESTLHWLENACRNHGFQRI
ncbi:sarcosine oxidase subunit gamma [Pararhizobium sp. IMCC21322]|uniref:sarcosine oxidase subunit gamma n=1 Tax=Pararhizobium sp. IMCC21322 TaxID=3067903 RepID=UPI0027417A0C|nr:sarcosine oxidase subunit gamma family protein [Pararhizobium sp. IMCC21322]